MKRGLLRAIFSVSVSLSHGFMRVCYANIAERIEVLLGVETLQDLRNIVLDEDPNFTHGFDAAFAKLLWPLVILSLCTLQHAIYLTQLERATAGDEDSSRAHLAVP